MSQFLRILLLNLLVHLCIAINPYVIPKQILNREDVFTTASFDAFTEHSTPSINLIHTTEDKQGSDVDYGTTISHVLAHFKENGTYDKRIRPNYRGLPVEVRVTLFVCGISHISEANMDVTLDFYFRQFWHDHRLNFQEIWNEEMVVSGDYMHEIWRPDTFFVNAKSSRFHDVTAFNTLLRISPMGNVTKSLRLTVTTSCPMNFRYFPMDSQQCSVQIESYGYTENDIAYRWMSASQSSVTFSPAVHNLPQFRIRGHREYYSQRKLSTGNYSRLYLVIYLEREIGYYIIQVYLPSSLIVTISILSFWISRDSPPARVSLGITTVLTMTTLTSSTNAALPKISYLKAIDVYLMSCFVMVFAALLEYAAVTYTKKQCTMFDNRSKDKIIPSAADFCGDATETCCNFCSAWNAKASDIEKYSRVVFPTVFICFNVGYWIIYLNASATEYEVDFMPA